MRGLRAIKKKTEEVMGGKAAQKFAMFPRGEGTKPL